MKTKIVITFDRDYASFNVTGAKPTMESLQTMRVSLNEMLEEMIEEAEEAGRI